MFAQEAHQMVKKQRTIRSMFVVPPTFHSSKGWLNELAPWNCKKDAKELRNPRGTFYSPREYQPNQYELLTIPFMVTTLPTFQLDIGSLKFLTS